MEHGPIWIVNAPTPPYPEERFDGDMPTTPPLNPQQPTPEQIADAAREALKDMTTVFSNWMFPTISDLAKLKALAALLRGTTP